MRLGKTPVNKKIKIGMVSGSLWRKEELSEGELNHHVHVIGASGYGKSVLLSHIVRNRIEEGKGLLYIDLKGERETLLGFSKIAARVGRIDDFESFSLTDASLSLPYNMIQDGTPTQLRDRIILSLNWSEQFYKEKSSSFLLRLLIVLCWLRDHQQLDLNFSLLLDCLSNPEILASHSKRLPEDDLRLRGIADVLIKTLKDRPGFDALEGLRSQIESLVLSDFGSLISRSGGINLFAAAQKSKIVCLFLDTRRYGETAKTIGKLILQDLKAASARVDAEIPVSERKSLTVVIDEFADLAGEDFIAFLDRARSSKFFNVLAHQEMADLNRISPEFAARLMGNTSTLYAFLQKRPESAEIVSKMAGTRRAWKETVQSEKFFGVDLPTGTKSLREVEEFNIHPNLVKTLRVGKCVCIKKYPRSRAYLVDVAGE